MTSPPTLWATAAAFGLTQVLQIALRWLVCLCPIWRTYQRRKSPSQHIFRIWRSSGQCSAHPQPPDLHRQAAGAPQVRYDCFPCHPTLLCFQTVVPWESKRATFAVGIASLPILHLFLARRWIKSTFARENLIRKVSRSPMYTFMVSFCPLLGCWSIARSISLIQWQIRQTKRFYVRWSVDRCSVQRRCEALIMAQISMCRILLYMITLAWILRFCSYTHIHRSLT